jgi:hypothetical protein
MEVEKGELCGANWEEDNSGFSWGNLKESDGLQDVGLHEE